MKMENQFWFLEYHRDYDKPFEVFAEEELCYDQNKKKWVKRKEYTGYWWPATFPCRSYRAAKRHLKKHDEIPKGTKFKLVSQFVGFDRWLIKK